MVTLDEDSSSSASSSTPTGRLFVRLERSLYEAHENSYLRPSARVIGYLDLHDNNFVGTMPNELCERKLDMLVADCHGPKPEVKCDCCHVCCQGMPEMICVDQKTGLLVDYTI